MCIMLQNSFTRPKFIRLCLLGSILILLVFFLLVSDSLISKIHSPNVAHTCILCPFKNNASSNNAEFLHFTILSDDSHPDPVNIMLFFVHANRNIRLKHNFNRCISSLLIHATPPLHVHVLTDDSSVNDAIEILESAAPLAKSATQVSLYDLNIFIKPLEDIINTLRPHFSFKQGAYYSDGLFYISIGLYKVMNVKQLILIDADVKILNDIKYLFNEFEKFSRTAMIGIAREQQPVYRHILSEYRKLHNDTVAGGPPPNGTTGFNSGVLLLHLEKMKNSTLYKDIVDNSSVVLRLIEKYKFKGHLGDQDFYSLISLDFPALFHELPCTWNRQLCEWWRYHGYNNVFNLYHNCSGNVSLLHGNCKSTIPDS